MIDGLKVVYKHAADLIPYANNSRTHSDEQVAQVAASIKEFGFTNPILVDEHNGIIAGHGRLMAANKLKLEQVPTITLAGLSEAQKKAYVIADNKLALNGGWDNEMLAVELEQLKDLGFDLDLIGFDAEELAEIDEDFAGLGEGLGEGESRYTAKVATPIYEIKGKKPELKDLYDREKYKALRDEVEASDIPEDIKIFLISAASRHIRFNYENIAEYYAHADLDVKKLIENSALVIIDYEKAIEQGYVELTEKLMELSGLDDE